MPFASNTRVLASSYSPCTGICRPLNKKSTPPALPTLINILWRAATVVSEGAINVRYTICLPSALTEIHASRRTLIETENPRGASNSLGASFDTLLGSVVRPGPEPGSADRAAEDVVFIDAEALD
jgi:hypothetical protein